jgi:mRNA interferase MazF
MSSYSKNEVILVRYPFSTLSGAKVRPGVIVNALHVPTAVKRGLYTVHETLMLKRVGCLTPTDAEQVEQSLRQWLDLP